MRLLYIFPHPDDESFGPAPCMAAQLRLGHEVFLLTLTRGGATRQRHKFGYSVEAMGEARLAEMREVKRTLGLSGMEVLDLPDSGLKEMDPLDIEMVIEAQVRKLRPQIVITYPVHGISGFHDHLVTHAVVKNLFCRLRGTEGAPRRLAFFTLPVDCATQAGGIHRLSGSTDEEIDCVMALEAGDLDAMRRALACYVTYQDVIAESKVMETVPQQGYFEIFGENHQPPLADLSDRLP